ncbi:uncharacterized protein LDX57_009410 [Aspergillus melleus]|uniref:uncharacterized protein n=1 Tax=Aspergillus melleus TaxID=138277 RepID=UPI001E8EF2D3|nr:uncharacterized protein LDX57_009410 [Aspergillus melleus]KAH8431757.1 hypothetical protein LDX57_009410 [Aspergillus melleus]
MSLAAFHGRRGGQADPVGSEAAGVILPPMALALTTIPARAAIQPPTYVSREDGVLVL